MSTPPGRKLRDISAIVLGESEPGVAERAALQEHRREAVVVARRRHEPPAARWE